MPKAEAPARPPIDPEELAAFIDGRLEGERRRLMIERLAEDEDAYDLYDEVVRVRAELAESEGAESAEAEAAIDGTPGRSGTGRDRSADSARVVRFPGRALGWPALGWAAAAAVLVATVVAGWLLIRAGAPVVGSSGLLARYSHVGPRAAEVALEALAPTRGTPALTPEERGTLFKLGVRAFDLAVAAEAEDRERAKSWLGEIDDLLDGVVASDAYRNDYGDIARQLTAGTTLSSLRPAIAAAEADLEDYLDLPGYPPYFAFGRWVEAMRVAAATGDRRFLASREARRPLRRFMSLEPSATVAGNLIAVAEELERGAAADLGTIERAMLEVINECARGSLCLGADDAD